MILTMCRLCRAYLTGIKYSTLNIQPKHKRQ